MTEAIVNSTICGFVHKLNGRLEGDKIIIDIDSPCEKIEQMSHMDVPMMEILDIKDNYVMEKAQEAGCSSNCLVPCAVLNICRVEAGFLSKSLVDKSGPLVIEFK